MPHEPRIKALSKNKRSFYFYSLVTIFVVTIPFLFMYATGYRFEKFDTFVRTGGMYIGAERADAEIYVDGELIRSTGTFRRAFFIQDLDPGTYNVEVIKNGNYPWSKTLTVNEHLVTEAQAFNIPLQPSFINIPRWLGGEEIEGVVSTTSSEVTFVENPVYKDLEKIFATSTATTTVATLNPATPTATTTSAVLTTIEADALATTTKESRGMVLYERGDDIVAKWSRDLESIPYYFCSPEKSCKETIIINTKGEKPLYFDFLPGSNDLVVLSLPSGVYVSEIDDRSGQNIQPLVEGAGIELRVYEDALFVKKENVIFRVQI